MREEGPRRYELPLGKLISQGRVTEWRGQLLRDPIPPRRRVLSPLEQDWLRQTLTQWRSEGSIQPGFALWAANPVFVQKKDGRIRVCADYRPVNAALADFEWPMPRIQDIRHWVKGYTWFARIDLTNAFHRITVAPEHRDLTALWTPWGQVVFTVMEFGLKTAPAFFQRYMDTTLQGEQNSLPYMDDTLIRARSRSELRHTTRRILYKLRGAGSTPNDAKSKYDAQALTFCGLNITPAGIDPPPGIAELRHVPCPYTKKDRLSALGLVNYFREHLEGLSHLTPLLYPDQQNRTRSNEYETDWLTLLERVTNAISLTHFRDEAPATLFTDASKWGTGAVLVQNGKVVALTSRSLTPAQSRYSTTDREQLSLVHAAEKFKVYLHRNQQTTLANDHRALLNRRKELTPRQERWRTIVLSMTHNLRYEPGASNPADFLSRKGAALAGGGRGIKEGDPPPFGDHS